MLSIDKNEKFLPLVAVKVAAAASFSASTAEHQEPLQSQEESSDVMVQS